MNFRKVHGIVVRSRNNAVNILSHDNAVNFLAPSNAVNFLSPDNAVNFLNQAGLGSLRMSKAAQGRPHKSRNLRVTWTGVGMAPASQ